MCQIVFKKSNSLQCKFFIKLNFWTENGGLEQCDPMYELHFKEPGSLKANKQHAFKMAIISKSQNTRRIEVGMIFWTFFDNCGAENITRCIWF